VGFNLENGRQDGDWASGESRVDCCVNDAGEDSRSVEDANPGAKAGLWDPRADLGSLNLV
jgi:hypothetical protein